MSENYDCEIYWTELIDSTREQQLVLPVRSMKKSERIQEQRQIAREICGTKVTCRERIHDWLERTGLSQATFYRYLKENREADRTASV